VEIGKTRHVLVRAEQFNECLMNALFPRFELGGVSVHLRRTKRSQLLETLAQTIGV
jgi:hypothetical protein